METFQTIWKFSRHSGNFPDNLVTSQKIWKLSRPSILSRLYEKFPDKTETFQTIQKHSRQSGNFPDDPETFQKLQWFSRQVPDIIDKSSVQKLSGRAKTFQGAMLPRSLRISVSGGRLKLLTPLDPSACSVEWLQNSQFGDSSNPTHL